MHRLFLFLVALPAAYSFVVSPTRPTSSHQSALNLFDKVFEEEGPLGKGITVGKVQVALLADDRGKDSIFGLLESNARWIEGDDEASSLADLAHDVCLSLLRKRDSWTGAASTSKWFSAKDYGKAESLFNDWSNAEASKFEKEYIPDVVPDDAGATVVVVSVVIEIEGDETKYVCCFLICCLVLTPWSVCSRTALRALDSQCQARSKC